MELPFVGDVINSLISEFMSIPLNDLYPGKGPADHPRRQAKDLQPELSQPASR
jgi:hypothetical protein